MNEPIPYEKQEPQLAAVLMELYARGAVLVAYFWHRGFKNGVGRTPRTPNHTPIVVEADDTDTYFF